MAIEPIRGCGYRKVGGLYMVSDGLFDRHCSRLPAPLHTCPTCGQGIKQSRGFTWVEGQKLLEQILPECLGTSCGNCPLGDLESIGEHAGLLWVGQKFYPTPRHFTEEAARYGISRRLSAVPNDFVVGEHWVMLAHPAVFPGKDRMEPGIFSIFKPQRIEIIVTESDSENEELMDGYRRRGLSPVIVPDDDPDHVPKRKRAKTT